uniref:Transformation/transcription domain-associated protein n=1 Tax=Cacopsylla melanoneura TaxID=428564 RepID=A0A8D8UEY6_9HEMI
MLPLLELSMAVHLFSRNIHDETLATTIQTMSCKLLFYVVDAVRSKQQADESGHSGEDLLLRMLEIMVLKLKSIAKLQLPVLSKKAKEQLSQTAADVTSTEDTKPINIQTLLQDSPSKENEKQKNKFGPASSSSMYVMTDCKNLVKVLVLGIERVTMGLASVSTQPGGKFQPQDTRVYIRLVKWGMRALDIYSVSSSLLTPSTPTQQGIRTKEEKDVLEHFAGIFLLLAPQSFKEIFSKHVDYMVERVSQNYNLQVIVNVFVTKDTSPIFATLLVEYLLEHMHEMGDVNTERSDLYLKLFKIVFESVSSFAENEHMLRPHVHSIVNKSMELAMTARKPFNYFLLLKVLFLSIGNGKHDLLYQEFLPLLRNLFQGLNNLQSGLHKKQMKDLFVELCLNVPVRLSSLLPYLPMLMDPLVSALNGSPPLISQGLRTLELFVGNLQPDFLYDHIQPVRAELMQALWRSLRNPNDQVALVAFRVLGKFGGGNRKMIEPQKLEFNLGKKNGPALIVHFPDHQKTLNILLENVMETAVNTLKSPGVDLFYRKQAWEVIKHYIIASMSVTQDQAETMNSLSELNFNEPSDVSALFAKYSNVFLRNNHKDALIGMFLAYNIKEIRKDVVHFSVVVVRQYTMVAIMQQCCSLSEDQAASLENKMDPLVLIDALSFIFSHEDKEFCKPGYLVLRCILDTATTLCGSQHVASTLPLMDYLLDQMCALCYEKAWYTKLGGSYAIQFLYKNFPLSWLLSHIQVILKALLFVIMDLTGDVSSGALDQVKQSLQDLIVLCAGPVEPDTEPLQSKALLQVGEELVRNIATSNTWLREQSMQLLKTLAETQRKSVGEIMEPHRDIVTMNIPPKKLNITDYSANAQIGLMEANTFCQSLTPRFFSIDVNENDHHSFFQHVYNICESSDQALIKMPCYKSVDSLVPLRKAAMRALASWHYVPGMVQKIFNVLYLGLDKPNTELQTAAFEAMKTFVNGSPIELKTMYDVTKPFLLTLRDYVNFDLKSVKKLSYIVQSFPSIFNEKLCQQLLINLKNLFDDIATQKAREDTEKVIIIIMEIFQESPAAKPQFIDSLIGLVLQHEQSLSVGHSPYRIPLVKYLLRYPSETLQSMLTELHMKDAAWRHFLVFLIKHADGKSFRDCLQTPQFTGTLTAYTSAALSINSHHSLTQLPIAERLEMQYTGIRLVSILIKMDDKWLSSQTQLVSVVQKIWRDSTYLERHCKVENISYVHWKEPKLAVKIILHYFSRHPNIIDLLFFTLMAVTDKLLPDFTFLREFLDVTVAQTYPIEWKRNAFIRFIELFKSNSVSQELKAKILQLILIPCFTVCFERGEGDELIAGTKEEQKNLATFFISQIVEAWEPSNLSDSLRILVLQMSCLLVEKAYHHINDTSQGKTSNNIVKPLIIFAWPSLLSKNCVDPATQYYGHLLLSHVIAKFAVSKRIVVQVFISLLKAHASEVSAVVRQALEILTPTFPERVDNGYRILAFWTKKIIIEEGHSHSQLFHLLTLIVKHYKVYYPVRHGLIQQMIASMQRLGFSSSAMDHKKLSVELADVIIKWELQRVKEEAEDPGIQEPQRKKMSLEPLSVGTGEGGLKNIKPDITASASKPIDKVHVDAVINFLARLSCQVSDLPPNLSSSMQSQVIQTPGEMLSRRCVSLIRMALKPEVWSHQNVDFKLTWLDKVLSTIDQPNANLGNISIALELLTLLITILDEGQILHIIKPLQRGLVACISSSITKVIRLVHTLLCRLMSIFPTEPISSSVASKREELDHIYVCVSKVIFEGLSNYEKNPTATCSTLYGTVMMLKAACVNHPAYVDRFILEFMRVIQRMAREHIATSTADAPQQVGGELLIYCLDLVKNRFCCMSQETRKQFIGTIILGLIDKTPDIKVMKAIIKMTEDWLKINKSEQNNVPNLKEKGIILVKLMHFVEKRFPDLNTQFLEIVLYVYMDENLKNSELVTKLEPAFLSGLRCSNPMLRAKFFQLFNGSIRRLLHDRLLYIFSSQNWEPMGPHYWLKQCIELILVSAISSCKIKLAEETGVLPNISSVISLAEDPVERENYFNVVVNASDLKTEPNMSGQNILESLEEYDIDEKSDAGEFGNCKIQQINREDLLNKQSKFLESAREYNTSDLLVSLAQLCHLDTQLADKVWLDMFPQLWSILNDNQQQNLTDEIIPFIVSGIHVVQKDVHPSSINTIYEALAHCNPPLPIKPTIMTYLGKAQGLWHRVTLSLEKMAVEGILKQTRIQNRVPSAADCYDFEPDHAPQQQDIIDQLAEMYSALREEDMWLGLWQKNAKHKETLYALAYEQQGFFEQALKAYEVTIVKGLEEYATTPAPMSHNSELRLREKQWIRCAKELNQWDTVLEYGKHSATQNPFLILESAWKVPDWKLMKEALAQVEPSCPKELQWKVHLYRGFLAICNPDEQPQHQHQPQYQLQHLSSVERYVELASQSCMNLWKSYPHIVSHIHLPLLQAAQQIMELQEAAQIHQSLIHGRTAPNSLHDMKATVKTWRNRLPVIADDLSHWSDVFIWRQHHYQFITQHYDALKETGSAGNRSILGVHSSAQAIIQFGKIARKHHLTSVCLDSLFRLYTIPSVPIVDCFEKIRQQVKCYLQMAALDGKNQLQEGLEVIEHTNLKYLTKEMTAEFYALKGMLLAQIGRSAEANKAFSAAVQMHDVMVKAWALWGDYMEAQFTNPTPQGSAPNMTLGVFAVTCFLHACRHQKESMSRKYLAKVLWLLTYDGHKSPQDSTGEKHVNAPLMDALDKYSVGMPPIQWLPWIPQLLTCLATSSGNSILSLLTQVSKVYPQAVFLPIRTMYFTLKIEQRERYKIAEQSGKPIIPPPPSDAPGMSLIHQQQQHSQGQPSATPTQDAPKSGVGGGESAPIRATPSMWRCSRIMHTQREMHPPVLISLEGIVDQMVWFRENWYEEVLRQVKLGLTKCYGIAFENRDNVNEAIITHHTLNFVRKLITTFGIGIENVNSMTATFASAGSESLARRAQQTIQDPVFQRMKTQFTADFDFKVPGATKLHNLISKLKKWIKILEAKNKLLPKSCLIEEKCRYLSNFNLHTAEIELPGEYLLPKHSHYYVRISRFMPRVDIVEKHNTAARRLYIRGHNGKIYPYLVMNDSGLIDSRRDERVLQMLRMLNHYLSKQKETAKRFLHFTVPRVVPISAEFRLVEDNPASLSLLDIYKSRTEEDHPVDKYYQELARYQSSGTMSDQGLLTIYQDIQNTLVHPGLLNTWAVETFHSSTDYWTFRKMGTLQLALACFSEYVFHLTRLSPDMIYLHQDSGLLNVSYFKFDLNESTGELHADKPVPFRLTPNIVQFLTRIGVDGPLSASIVAVARCLSQPNYQVPAILKAILRDEMIAFQKKIQNLDYDVIQEDPPDVPGDMTISMVTRAVTVISSRLNTLAQIQSPVSELIATAQNPSHLSKMDPCWMPWL